MRPDFPQELVHLAVKHVDQVKRLGLGSHRDLWAAEFECSMVAGDQVMNAQAEFGREGFACQVRRFDQKPIEHDRAKGNMPYRLRIRAFWCHFLPAVRLRSVESWQRLPHQNQTIRRKTKDFTGFSETTK